MLDKIDLTETLERLLFKDNSKGLPAEMIGKSEYYMIDRFISFYHPQLAELINQSMNKALFSLANADIIRPDEERYFFELLDASIPKLPGSKYYYNYIKKPSRSKLDKMEGLPEFVHTYAKKHCISEREVWGMLYMYDIINE